MHHKNIYSEDLPLEILKSTEEHHIYHEWYLNGRAGGPPGYLANLLYGYNQIPHYDKPYIIFDSLHGKPPAPTAGNPSPLNKLVRNIVGLFPGGKEYYNAHLSRSLKISYENMYNFLSDLDNMMPMPSLIETIDWSRTKAVHVHTVAEAVKIKNYLRKHFLDDVKVILTCHTPETCANEQYNLALAEGQSEERAQALKELWFKLEMRAYREVDVMIFPSKEATEPLVNAVEGFQELLDSKDVRYMATGCKRLSSALTKEQAKEKYNVSGKTVIGYIGRHNAVKGYDLLKEAAKIVLSKTNDVVFLIGGAQGKDFGPLDNPNWIEAGWVNPADLLQSLDVFVLPNRQTYYDLVLLEVLSMGVPVVATATGGNKSVQQIANDLELCGVSAESLAEHILKLVEMKDEDRLAKGQRLQDTYLNYFTESHMAQRYVDTICQIYDDLDLWNKEDNEA